MAVLALIVLVLLASAMPDLCPRGLERYGPDVWVLVAVHLALRVRGYAAVGWGILLGVVRDALSLDPLGTHAFVLGAVAFLFCEGRRQRGNVDAVLEIGVTFLAALLAGWLYVLRVLPLGAPPPWPGLWHAVPVAVVTAGLGLVLHPLLDRFHVLDDLGRRVRGLPA